MPQMHIDNIDLTETIDALEFALLALRRAFTFAAAKEQRRGRANELNKVCCGRDQFICYSCDKF